MADLFFPQLSTGALAQYPIRKTNATRTIRNILPDSTQILAPDSDAAHMIWQLAYQALSSAEITALSAHFTACQGRLHAFTFIDPTDNMLAESANPKSFPWLSSPGLALAGGASDPMGGTNAFVVTNNAQVPAQLSQSLPVPADYQYCFSFYAKSAANTTVNLIRAGQVSNQIDTAAVGTSWSRIVSSGALADTGTGLTVSISLAPGQQMTIFGPQLEAQVVPSRYRSTYERGGVYTDAHWAIDALPVISDGPALYSTAFSIEARL